MRTIAYNILFSVKYRLWKSVFKCSDFNYWFIRNVPPTLLFLMEIGLLLFVAGLYFVSTGLTDSSFSSGLIGMLFLFYGFFTLKSVLVRK